MRVAIDALPLLVRSAGVKNYLYYWIAHLRAAAGSHEIRLFPPLGALGPLDHERPAAGPWRTARALGTMAAINHAGLPLHDWLARADIFHSTNLIHRPPRRMRLTATVHDMTTWTMPETHASDNVRADRAFERLLRSADALIAVSECTRRDVVRLLGIDERKVTAIHSGVAEPFFRAGAAEAAAARAALGLARPYALYLGTVEPRKNLGTLLDAWEALPADVRAEYDLAIAGPEGWAGAGLRARLDSPPAGVRRLGYVPERHLPGLTAGATLFAYPSLYEGFGFPVAQAMAAGVPVVTSNVSSLPEVAGDAAALVDPRSAAELGAAMLRLLTSAAERETRSAAGRARAARFTWEECARRSLAFFESLL